MAVIFAAGGMAAQWILTVMVLVVAIGFGVYGYNKFKKG
jgi:hypothetical protein